MQSFEEAQKRSVYEEMEAAVCATIVYICWGRLPCPYFLQKPTHRITSSLLLWPLPGHLIFPSLLSVQFLPLLFYAFFLLLA